MYIYIYDIYENSGEGIIALEIIFMVLLLILVLLPYFSNPNNKANKWCSIAGFVFWLGIAKEAILFSIIPYLQTALKNDSLHDYFMPVYSVATWDLYSLAMPFVIIFSLYFSNMHHTHPKPLRMIKVALFIPVLLLSFFFPPLDFRFYQLSCLLFWIAYGVHNLGLGIMYTFYMIKGVRTEKPGKSKEQKKRVTLILLPPVLFWMTSVFLTHPFNSTIYLSSGRAMS